MNWLMRVLLIALILTPGSLSLWGWHSFKVYTVPSCSMESTILAGDVVMVRNLDNPTVQRVELVVVDYPGHRTVKRVVAISVTVWDWMRRGCISTALFSPNSTPSMLTRIWSQAAMSSRSRLGLRLVTTRLG